MPDPRDERNSDYRLLIEHDGDIRRLKEEIAAVKTKVDLLMTDRAKLIGWCAGASGAVAILVKFIWPTHA